MSKFISNFILPILLGALAVSVQAQSILGFKGGANLAYVSHSKDDGGGVTNRKIWGVSAGFYVDIDRSKRTAIRPELNFIQKGFIRQTPLGGRIYRLNYYDLAVLFKYSFVNIDDNRKKKMQFHACLLVGPFVGYSGAGKITIMENGKTSPYKFNGGVSLRHADAGMVFAGGVELPLGPGYLVTDLRYNLGLLPLSGSSSPNGVIRNHGIILSAGYGFLLGR
ncbi:MAG: outer membrane beta-barrel protein [Bacteroidetes bacterium]|nr:outer membrane beta-barrel protein [Bacteroidota bacterium]